MERSFNFTKKPTDNLIDIKKNALKGQSLDIKDHEVARNAIKQTIVWKLERALENANFTSFAWLNTPQYPAPPPGIFSDPEISHDGNWLTVHALNNDAKKSVGTFGYVITLELDGVVYTSGTEEPSPTDAIMMMIRDPVIINR